MTGTDDERHAALRIGGWLPPANPTIEVADDAVSTASMPATSAPVPDDPYPQPAAPAPRSALGEEPAHRVPGPGKDLRSRRIALAVATTAATLAAVPLAIGMVIGPAETDRSVQPPPALLPTAADRTPDVSIPTSAASSAVATPSAIPSATGSLTGPATGVPAGTRPTSAPATPPPARIDISFEAEGPTAVRGGAASIRDLTGASGGAVVTQIGNDSANLVRFTGVAVPTAGTYTVTFHYVSAERRRASITVNGQRALTVNFPLTSDWGTVDRVSVRLPLVAGSNTVEFGNRNDWAPDLDRMVVTG